MTGKGHLAPSVGECNWLHLVLEEICICRGFCCCRCCEKKCKMRFYQLLLLLRQLLGSSVHQNDWKRLQVVAFVQCNAMKCNQAVVLVQCNQCNATSVMQPVQCIALQCNQCRTYTHFVSNAVVVIALCNALQFGLKCTSAKALST